MGKIKALGGIFVKTKNSAELKKWYAEHLGAPVDDYGATFKFRDFDNPKKEEFAVWSPFKDDTTYFAPSKKEFMINFIVEDLDGLLKRLEKDGIKQTAKMEEYEYGRFAWIVDPEGTKIELWEPPTK